MRIAVLMTCYNRVETTLRCLRSLFAQMHAQSPNPTISNQTIFEVWLVDDASPDGTGAKVKAEFPQVNVIRGTGKLFWSRGMRLAWDTAAAAKDYDGYLWLNDDVELYPDAIATLLADAAQVGDEAVLVGTTHMRFGDEELSYGPDSEHGLVRPNGSPQRVQGVMSGNFVYVPRKVFRAIGPIYGGYSHGYGDRDYALLTDRKGVPRYCCSKVVGVCPQQPERYRHRLKHVSIRERFRVILTPNGFSIRDNFIYKFRNFGFLRAVGSAVHIFWIRVVRGHED